MADEADVTTAPVDESTADSGTEAPAPEATTTDEVEGTDALGDAGKKALDAMKADRNKYRDTLRERESELEAMRAKADGREAEHQAAIEAQRVKDEALSAANDRLRRAEIRAQAAGKLNDPKDALSFLDMSEFEVGDDGEIDGDTVAAAIDDLIKNKPYLAAQSRRFEGDADGGARKESGETQLTRDDLSRMSPEEINTAHADGRLNDLLGAQ